MRKLLLGVAVLAVFAAACTQTEAEPVEAGSYEVTEDSVDVNLEAARIAWTVIPQSDRTVICDYYNTPPVGITPDMVRIFDQEVHLGYAESERVLSTLLAEEC